MITKLGTELLAHQQRVIDRLREEDRHGLIAQHSLGSGKTLTALKALEDYRKTHKGRGLFVVPASLQDNVRKELEKHKVPLRIGRDFAVVSYDRAMRHAKEYHPDFLVFDEAHRLRNRESTKRVRNLIPVINNADKVLMLTGTAGYNHPSDIPTLISLIDRSVPIPRDRKEFSDTYIDDANWSIHEDKKPELRRILSKYLDIHKAIPNSKDFPKVEYKSIHVPMSDKQLAAYRLAESKLPPELQKAVRQNLPLSLQESTNLNMFSTGTRQASLSPMHHDVTAKPTDSTKLLAALKSVKHYSGTPGFRAVAYSNYLDAGLSPYKELLSKTNIKPLLFTGSLNKEQKKALIDEYNKKDKLSKILLLSSSGGEGLDLKRTRLLQVLEPHFNKAKIDQVIGRGARYKSHDDLPEKDRKMLVERYYATMQPTMANKVFGTKPDTAIDDYLQKASDKKQKLIDEMMGLAT